MAAIVTVRAPRTRPRWADPWHWTRRANRPPRPEDARDRAPRRHAARTRAVALQADRPDPTSRSSDRYRKAAWPTWRGSTSRRPRRRSPDATTWPS